MAVPKPTPITDADEPITYRLTVSESGTIVLPPEISLQLDLQPGDEVVLTLEADGRLAVRHGESEQLANAPLRGLLRGYFKDREDIQRFIEEERRGWAEREERLDRQWEEAIGRKGDHDEPSNGS